MSLSKRFLKEGERGRISRAQERRMSEDSGHYCDLEAAATSLASDNTGRAGGSFCTVYLAH